MFGLEFLDPKPEAQPEDDVPSPSFEADEDDKVEEKKDQDPRPILYEEALECDYERNCTTLYKRIENAISDSEWNPIIQFLDTGSWPGLFVAIDTIKPEIQARTWVTRFDPHDRNRVRWSQLPLHLAIVCGAPFTVVGRLIELYPQGVRCTDDQRNLPIHLAMRHNASDDVIAYLLMQFPESVNARGKAGRTPIECALRAESKLRGKILEVFATKLKKKNKLKLLGGGMKSSLGEEGDATSIHEELEAKTLALENAESKLTAMQAIKDALEDDLSKKVEQSEKNKEEMQKSTHEAIAELKDQLLVDKMELKKKIDDLEAEKQEIGQAELKARKDEAKLLQELESVTKAVSVCKSSSDLEKVKKDIESIKSTHIEQSKLETKKAVEQLNEDVDKRLQRAGSKEAGELKSTKKMAAVLSKSITSAKTADEVVSVRDQVESLRSKVKKYDEASKTKVELKDLRKSLEDELKNPEGKSPKDLAALKRAVDSLDEDNLDKMTNEELIALKKEFEDLRKELQESKLVSMSKKDAEELKDTLETELKGADASTKVELAETKKTVDKIHSELSTKKSNADLISLKKELNGVKKQIKEKTQMSKLRDELLGLKEELEAEMKTSECAESLSRKDLASLKKAVKNSEKKALDSQSVNELSVQKKELESLKEDIARKVEVKKTGEEIEELKQSLEANAQAWEGKNKQGISDMLKEVDELADRNLKSTYGDREEVNSVKAELKRLRQEVNNVEKATETKLDYDMLNETLCETLKTTEGENADDLFSIKQTLDNINVDEIDIKNRQKWDSVRAELKALKKDLRNKEAGAGLLRKEIELLKSLVPEKKEKKGIKGFLSRVSFRRSSISAKAAPPQTAAPADPDDEVATILPPSLSNLADRLPSREKVSAPLMDSTDAETDEEPVPEEKTFKAEEATVITSKSKKSMKSMKSFKSWKSKKSSASRKSKKEVTPKEEEEDPPAVQVSETVDPQTGAIELNTSDDKIIAPNAVEATALAI